MDRGLTPSEAPLDRFLAGITALCAATGRKESGLSRQLFGHTQRIAEIRAGSDLGVRRLATAQAELDRLAAEAGITLPETPAPAESGAESPRPRAVGE